MAYLYLAGAIVLELIATTLLKYTEGFTKLFPTLGCCLLYGFCFFCLSRCLEKINLGIAYATWSGVGIVVTALISVFVFKERLSVLGAAAILMIVAGCVILNLTGSAH